MYTPILAHFIWTYWIRLSIVFFNLIQINKLLDKAMDKWIDLYTGYVSSQLVL